MYAVLGVKFDDYIKSLQAIPNPVISLGLLAISFSRLSEVISMTALSFGIDG